MGKEERKNLRKFFYFFLFFFRSTYSGRRQQVGENERKLPKKLDKNPRRCQRFKRFCGEPLVECKSVGSLLLTFQFFSNKYLLIIQFL